ncbi:MAG TPA: methyltransferase domain-containing protein [Streptosporangiaceae bacterium]|nr:methyltransferase domain-containing protein [Streptosporangiaceae bacterium]
MSSVHEVATRGFSAQAQAYDRARPSYPPDAVVWLAGALGIRPGRRIVDLAAGTGKFTALIADSGAELVAVEPVAAMRERLRRKLPGVPVVAGTAEALPFATGSADAVVVAQAFHWFDADRAMAELGRVVRGGGRLGLVWNARDRSVDWVDRVWAVMDRVERDAPWRDHRDGTGGPAAQRWSERDLAARDGWTPFTEATFCHVQDAAHEDVIDRIRSVSHVAVLPPASQAAVLDEIRAILREHPDTRDEPILRIPYRTDAMYTERLS